MSNKLWEAVCHTDPKYTKEFSRAGGFKGTAINPTYQVMRATDIFGPYGIGWGMRDYRSEFVPAGDEVLHLLQVEFWYKATKEFIEQYQPKGAVEGEVYSFPGLGVTTFLSKRNNGSIFMDEEAPKKSETDARTKCLSLLGFSADIHIGLYDSHKYVNDVRLQFAGEKTASINKPEQIKPKIDDQSWKDINEKLLEYKDASDDTNNQMKELFNSILSSYKIDKVGNVAEYTKLVSAFQGRKAALKKLDEQKPEEKMSA